MADAHPVTLQAKQIRRPDYRDMGFVTFQDAAEERVRLVPAQDDSPRTEPTQERSTRQEPTPRPAKE